MVVAGSRSDATLGQVANLLKSGTIEQVRIDPAATDGAWDMPRKTSAAARIVERLAERSPGATALVTSILPSRIGFFVTERSYSLVDRPVSR